MTKSDIYGYKRETTFFETAYLKNCKPDYIDFYFFFRTIPHRNGI